MRRKVFFSVFFVITGAALASVMLVPATNAEKVGLIDLCSNIAMNSMKSPSSYKINSASIDIMVGLPSVGAQSLKDGGLKDGVLSGKIPYRLANVTIQQEAKNPLGVSLAGVTYCRYSMFGEVSSASYKILAVEIDGNTLSEMDIIIKAKAGEYQISKNMYLKRLKYIWYSLTNKM